MSARLEAQHGAPELHGLAQGGAQVPVLLAVEDRRQLLTALLQFGLPVSDCSKHILLLSLSIRVSSQQSFDDCFVSITLTYSDKYVLTSHYSYSTIYWYWNTNEYNRKLVLLRNRFHLTVNLCE